LFLFAASRSSVVDRDYLTYIHLFENLNTFKEYFTFRRIAFFEPCFYFIPAISRFIFKVPYDTYACFSLFAFLGVYFKLKSFSLSNSFFLTAVLYGSSFYYMHEMTQIRVGIATGILLLSLKPCYERNTKSFLFHILWACFFHYSSIAYVFIYLLDSRKINLYKWLFIMFSGYFLVLLNLNIINLLFLPSIFARIDLYIKAARDKEFAFTINIYNYGIIINIVLTLILFWKIKILEKINPYVVLFTKINVLSIFAYTAFSILPVFAGRLSDLFGIIQLILYPTLIYVFKEKIIGYIIVIGYSFINFWGYFYYNKVIFPYSIWWLDRLLK
jgi:hypothetical protein